jgi:hypothetical protein
MGVRSVSRIFVCAVLMLSVPAHAVTDTSSCTPLGTYNAWISSAAPINTTTGAASAPAADTPYIPAGRPLNCGSGTRPCGRVYFAKGTTLLAFEDRGTATALAWTWGVPGAGMTGGTGTGEVPGGSITISNFPSATPGDSLHPMVVYLGADNGFLYKVDAQNSCNPGGSPACVSGTNVAPLLFKDLRRKDVNGQLICNTAPGDRVAATPAVLLNAYSPAGGIFQTFASAQGHAGADLIFATTFDGCGDHTHNAIHAI